MFRVLIPAVVLVAWLVLTFSKLVRMRFQTRSAWADIEVQVTPRSDLSPHPVETVKGYAEHEKKRFEAVVAARNRAMAPRGPAEKGPLKNF